MKEDNDLTETVDQGRGDPVTRGGISSGSRGPKYTIERDASHLSSATLLDEFSMTKCKTAEILFGMTIQATIACHSQSLMIEAGY